MAEAGRAATIGAVMVAVSGAAFGSLAVFNRQLADAFSVPQMLALRFAGGAAVLWVVALARGEVHRPSPKALAGFGLLGALYVAEAWCYFESSQRIPIALTALLLYLYPSLVVLVSWAVFKEAPGAVGLLALVASTVGIALALGAPSGELDTLGVAFGAGTAVVYTAYIVVGARVQRDGLAFGSAVLMTVAALGFTAVAILQARPFPAQALATSWAPLFGLVVIGTALPIPLLLFGMARLGATRASIISTLEPISAAVCGALFLDERLSVTQACGAALVVAAVVGSALRGHVARAEPDQASASTSAER